MRQEPIAAVSGIGSNEGAESILAAQNKVLEKLAVGCTVPELVLDVATLVETFTEQKPVHAACYVVDPRSGRITDGASPSLSGEIVRGIVGKSTDESELADLASELAASAGCEHHEILRASPPHDQLMGLVVVLAKEPLSHTPGSLWSHVRAIAPSLLVVGIDRLRVLGRLLLAKTSIDHSRQPAVCVRDDGSFLYVNDATCKALGYSRAELLEKPAYELFQDADARRFQRLWNVAESRGHLFLEAEMTCKDGSRLPVTVDSTYVRVQGEGYQCALLSDVSALRTTERKLRECEQRLARAEEKLRHDTLRDNLTGLPNRAFFMDHLRRSLERAKRAEKLYGFGVLFLDFDRFKRINDSLGHMAGDRLLVAVSRRLTTCVRPGDTVARLGGDEFALILTGVSDVTEAVRVAERIHNALRDPFPLHGMELFITASIGIAMGSGSYERPEDVLHDADTAMYRAKAAGKARHEVFDQAMHHRALEQLRLEAELRRALVNEEFRLLYQPIVSLSDRRRTGLEAFARWRHPTSGLLTPFVFLKAAEESGLIVDIGWWIFTEACRQATRWPENENLTLHVNISDKQLFQPNLTDRIEQVLIDSNLAPERLVLDIQENVIMQKADSSGTILAQLKSLGVRLHMDDFGTGYSSLGYLHRFQLDALKIDRSFVRHLRAGGDNWIAVRTIVNLAQGLGMEVIAEGVETEEQLDELLELGCAFGQGSLFCDPLPPDEVAELLQNGN